jgi:hypothetical protein
MGDNGDMMSELLIAAPGWKPTFPKAEFMPVGEI